ncbi:uncharacterized protein RCO7_11481 [Rhynchosporium graminicola]|uniref:Uncharacterized protein n=1 Tax=Rhynchosporium graminicola TaxID=2792576 RepID=A0A1E1LKY0_9HELO|nr:uncharacterized protein RCO7_11481 [Rhynchosporium commune]
MNIIVLHKWPLPSRDRGSTTGARCIGGGSRGDRCNPDKAGSCNGGLRCAVDNAQAANICPPTKEIERAVSYGWV